MLFYFIPVQLCRLFGLIFAVLIVDPVLYGVGQILLLDVMIRKIMGIQIVLSLDRRALAVKMLILQMSGKIAAFLSANVLQSRVYGVYARIGFRRGSKQYDRFRKRKTRFGKSELHCAVHAGFYYSYRLRTGK